MDGDARPPEIWVESRRLFVVLGVRRSSFDE